MGEPCRAKGGVWGSPHFGLWRVGANGKATFSPGPRAGVGLLNELHRDGMRGTSLRRFMCGWAGSGHVPNWASLQTALIRLRQEVASCHFPAGDPRVTHHGFAFNQLQRAFMRLQSTESFTLSNPQPVAGEVGSILDAIRHLLSGEPLPPSRIEGVSAPPQGSDRIESCEQRLVEMRHNDAHRDSK